MINKTKLIIIGILFKGLCIRFTYCDNYPDSDHIKPCAKKKNVIEYQNPICIPIIGGGFEPNSVSNCEKMLKAECPEFNEANCEWYSYTWNAVQMGHECKFATNILFPACKLRYKAHSGLKDKTWMEIFYVNQMGTKPNATHGLSTIVELHRYNYKYANFGDVAQPDWPLSVPKSDSSGGIYWSNPTEAYSLNFKICEHGEDKSGNCAIKVRDFARGLYDNSITTCMKEIFNLSSFKVTDVCWVKYKQTYDNGYTSTVAQCQFFQDNSVKPHNPPRILKRCVY